MLSETALDEVGRAHAWLVRVPQTARTTRARTSSPTTYGVKRIVEVDTGLYVSGGAMIVAAMFAGLVFERADPDLLLGLNRRWFRKEYDQALNVHDRRSLRFPVVVEIVE